MQSTSNGLIIGLENNSNWVSHDRVTDICFNSCIELTLIQGNPWWTEPPLWGS